MIHSAKKPINHFLCEGMEGVADNLKSVCQSKFNNFNIIGTFCLPFLPVDKYDYEGIANKVNESKADIIWVGLSSPKQEQLAYYLGFISSCKNKSRYKFFISH